MGLELRPARDEDCRRVWEWANGARPWSLSPAPIAWDEHLRWWDDNWHRVKIAEADGVAVGSWRVDGDGRVSIVVDPELRGKGHGTELIRLASSEEPGDLVAEVINGNSASERAFRSAGFRERSHHRRLVVVAKSLDPAGGHAGY